MPTKIQDIPSSHISVKYREQYGSAALNSKFTGVIAPGIYRGLTPSPGIEDQHVRLSPDQDWNDHVAVVTDANGMTLNYRGGGHDIDLDLSFKAGSTAVICLEIDYYVGSGTEARFVAYEESEFDNLSSSEKMRSVVVATVDVPGSGPILPSHLSQDRRSMVWQRSSTESVPWTPIIRNGTFEISDTGETYQRATSFWETESLDVSSDIGVTRTTTDDSYTESKSLEFKAISSGSISRSVTQRHFYGIPDGSRIRVRFAKKVVTESSNGSAYVRVSFADGGGVQLDPTDISIDLSSIDGQFFVVDRVLSPPAQASVLVGLSIAVDGAEYNEDDVALRIDDVQVWIEPSSDHSVTTFDSLYSEVSTASLSLMSPDADPATGKSSGAVISYDDSVENGVVALSRRDGDRDGHGPAFGSFPSADGDSEYSLVWISRTKAPASGSHTDIAYRVYATKSSGSVHTVNAYWDQGGDVWRKDDDNAHSSRINYADDGAAVLGKGPSSSGWWDGLWDGTSTFAIGGDLEVSGYADIGSLLHGDRIRHVHCIPGNGTWDEEVNGAYVYRSSPSGQTTHRIVAHMNQGDRIKKIRFRVQPGGTDAVVFVQYRMYRDGNSVSNDAETSSEGTDPEWVTIDNINTTITERTSLVLTVGATGSAEEERRFYMAEITYDHPLAP